MIGDQLQRCRNDLRDLAVDVDTPNATAADLSHDFENPPQRDAFTAEDVAMSRLPALHGKDQPFRGVAHIDKIHDKIKMQLMPPAEEIL